MFIALVPSDDDGLPAGPVWGRGRFQPEAANPVFATGDGCALCHSASPRASALYTASGDDASPHGLWSATPMANAFRDPYWRAQVAAEVERHPDRQAEIEALCLTCHAPMAHHTARLAGKASPTLAEAAQDPLARDGVSCTVCHQARPDRLGEEASFGGHLDIRPGREIYGPFDDPAPGPMRMHSAFTPTFGPHIRDSALCGACHTLRTHSSNGLFTEQAPYLEWRNSAFSTEDEQAGGQDCRECHMPAVGPMRIARNPAGLDFNIRIRDEVRGHAFVGGNALLLDLLREGAEALGVKAAPEALERAARATRSQLAHATARVTIDAVERAADRLQFAVNVENLTGHKFPSGYPSRRAWLNVEVRAGNETLFASGAWQRDSGGLTGIVNELRIPHVDIVERADQVAVYEMVALDDDGAPTTSLIDMARMAKDTRLLPRGWRRDGPHADETAPVGVGDDADFLGGADTVRYRIPLPDEADQLVIVVRLLYQSIPPAWAAPLAASASAEAAQFLALYRSVGPSTETVATAVAVVDR